MFLLLVPVRNRTIAQEHVGNMMIRCGCERKHKMAEISRFWG